MGFFKKVRSLFLFLSILFAILTSPLMISEEAGWRTLGLGLLWAFLFGVGGYLISSSKGWLFSYSFGIAFILGTVIFEMIFGAFVVNQVLRNMVTLLVQVSALYVSLRYALSRSRGNALDRTIGGICGYFLLGFAWSRFFVLVQLFDSSAFSMESGDFLASEADLLYYSFVSLTTLGYGDIVPINGFARILSALEGAFGTLYLAVLVATLVSELRSTPAKQI